MALSFVHALRDTVRAAFSDEPPEDEELFRLVKQHRPAEALEALRSHPRSWYIRDEGGHSLLHWAALGGHLDFARAALLSGVPADGRASRAACEQTPLMWAVCGGHASMVRLLVEGRASTLTRDARGATALVNAVQQEQLDLLPVLAELGGRELLNAGDLNNCTAVHWAAYAGNLEALARLHALDCNFNSGDASGMTPIQHAIWAYRPEAVEFLVDHGADPMLHNERGKNCIDMADEMRNPGMKVLLLSSMLKRLLARRPSKPGTPEGKTASAAQREVVDSTPVSVGAAATWAAAWTPPADAATGGDAATPSSGSRAPAPGGAAARGDGAAIVRSCTSLDIPFVETLEDLRQALTRHAEEVRTILRPDLMALFVVTDRHGACVDVLSLSQDGLARDRFPMHARLVGLPEISANELAKLGPGICTGASRAMRTHPELHRQRLLTKIPASFRWSVWKEVLRVGDLDLPKGAGFIDMASRENEWTHLILNDIGRTFTFFDRQQQQSLLRILNAYAVYNPGVGYCQGMNMIAGMLLLISGSEEESFGVLAGLMDGIGLTEFYREGFPLLRKYLDACDKIMAQMAPQVAVRFQKEGVELNMYVHQWFLTLFIDCLPLPLVVSVWDAIICEGLPVALRVVVTILTSLEDSLSLMKFQEIATAFKTMRRQADKSGEWKAFEAGHLLVRQAARVKVPESILQEHERLGHARDGRGSNRSTPDAAELCFS